MGGDGPGGSCWRSIGYGPGRVHRVVPAVNVPIYCSVCGGGAVGVVTWEKVSNNFSCSFRALLFFTDSDDFRLIVTFLIKNSDLLYGFLFFGSKLGLRKDDLLNYVSSQNLNLKFSSS